MARPRTAFQKLVAGVAVMWLALPLVLACASGPLARSLREGPAEAGTPHEASSTHDEHMPCCPDPLSGSQMPNLAVCCVVGALLSRAEITRRLSGDAAHLDQMRTSAPVMATRVFSLIARPLKGLAGVSPPDPLRHSSVLLI